MSQESRPDSAEISPSEFDKGTLLASFDAYPEFRRALQSATVLIIPSYLEPEYEGPLFPATTQEVFGRLREIPDDNVRVDAAIRDEDYSEYQYFSDAVILPALFVAKDVLLPLVIGVLANCLSGRGKGRAKQRGGQHRRIRDTFH